MIDSFGQIRVAAKTVDLSPTGDAGLYCVTGIVMWDLVLKIVNQLRALGARPNEAHVAFEHVPELRRLVNVPFSHKSANSKPARIIFCGPADLPVFFRIQSHTANLQHLEGLAIPAESSLAIEDRSGRFEIDQGPEDCDDGCG